MISKRALAISVLLSSSVLAIGQQVTQKGADSLTTDQIQRDKVRHAEPLYIDLIRDLGARKGEKEWNIGLGLTDKLDYDTYEALIEYEFAPIDRLGLEIELPFEFHSGRDLDSVPPNKLEGIQLATQWTFFVNKRLATSMALGYLHVFEMSDFQNFGNPLFIGNVYNPFFIIAKRWGQKFHTLIYTGPVFEHTFDDSAIHFEYDINSSVHYMIPGTNNFIGIEFNKRFDLGDFDMVMRPQLRLEIDEHFMIGIVAGIPVSSEGERMSAFVRMIWEPD